MFGLKIFDTNPDADEIAMRQPAIDPAFTFGLMPHAFLPAVPRSAGDPTPDPDAARLREIGRVIAVNREYAISYAGEERLRYGDAYHLALQPLRDPQLNRLRDIWIEKESHLLLRARVAGIYDGAPYDRVTWTVEYVPLEGRIYIQQVRTDQDMHFGVERIAHMKLDFVDYRFPKERPRLRLPSARHVVRAIGPGLRAGTANPVRRSPEGERVRRTEVQSLADLTEARDRWP